MLYINFFSRFLLLKRPTYYRNPPEEKTLPRAGYRLVIVQETSMALLQFPPTRPLLPHHPHHRLDLAPRE